MRWDILRCRYAPGQVINESELVRSFGVSKTPVREALQRLKQEGFVSIIPSVGYKVVQVTLEDAQELLAMRRILELAAVECTIVRITDEELERLEGLIKAPFLTVDEEAVVRWFEENTAFHSALAEACGIQRLARAVREVFEESLRLYFITTNAGFDTEIGVANHKRIVKALRRRDLERVRELLVWEVDAGIQQVIDGLAAQAEQGDAEGHGQLTETNDGWP